VIAPASRISEMLAILTELVSTLGDGTPACERGQKGNVNREPRRHPLRD
jgi:hypothetical protein